MNGVISKNRPSHRLSELLEVFRFRSSVIAEFERAFAEMVGAQHAIVFPHCRTAIRDLLKMEGLKGQEVLLPAYTCVVVPHAVVLARAKPVFLDISLSDYNVPLESFLNYQGEVGALIPTYLYGNHFGLQSLEDRFSEKLIIEDCSLGLHPAYRPQSAKSRLVTVYSTGYTKHLSTNQGGVVVCHDERLAKKIRDLRNQHYANRTSVLAQVRQAVEFMVLRFGFEPVLYRWIVWHRKVPFLLKRIDTRCFEAPLIPEGRGWSPMPAAVGLKQIDRAQEILKKRREITERYYSAFQSHPNLIPMFPHPGSHLSQCPVRVPGRDEHQFRERTIRLGVEMGRMLDYSCPELAYYRERFYRDCPNARLAGKEMVTIPNFPDLNSAQVDHVIRSVLAVANEIEVETAFKKSA